MNTNPVHVFAKWQVKNGRLAAVLDLLQEVARKSREEKGNLFYKIHQSIADKNTIVLSEAYVDQSAVEEHRNSAYFQELVIGRIVPDLDNREVIVASELL